MGRPTQSLQRGLSVLELLNRRPGLNANHVARFAGLTRGTAFRTLETLRGLEYVRREMDGSYWVSARVRALADGFNEDAWVDQIARPQLESLSRKLVWPLTVSTPSGTSMLVRLNTDFTSPLTKNRFAVGHRISLVASASGRAYLAFCPSGQRSVIIDLVARSSARPEDASARNPSALYRDLAQVRAAGYATHSEGDRSAVAVPILWRRHPFACLALRYFTTALRAAEVRRKIVPEILSCAQAISSQFEQADPSAGIGSNDTVPG